MNRADSAWAPLNSRVFRILWMTWVVSNVCLWMNDVAAAWLMTSLTTSPAMVALVQTAAMLPMFLLGLPSGALADILDRRRYFMATQLWLAGVALAISVVLLMGWMTAPLLLMLVFANGIGLAMRLPVFAAIVPELVPREQLPAAVGLNGLAMNGSRIIGPLVAGLLIASVGTEAVFLLNAVLSLGAAAVIWRWRRERKPSALPGERFLGAIRVGMQYVRESDRMHAALGRTVVFFLQSTALMAMLPLVAQGLGGGAGGYTILIASMGGGAILAVWWLPRIRQRWGRDQLIRRGTVLQALATVGAAFAPNLYAAVPALFISGMTWLVVANSLSVAAQLSLPDWVRARGMSIFQMALMGSAAASAAIWGQVASFSSVRVSLVAAAVTGVTMMLLTRRWQIEGGFVEDMTPSAWTSPPTARPVEPDEGPVLVTVEYRIDPARTDEFKAVMEESRRSRLRRGALAWELFHDVDQPDLYIEYYIDESWVEHLRRVDRATAYDVQLRARRTAFHLGLQAPKVMRCIAENVALLAPWEPAAPQQQTSEAPEPKEEAPKEEAPKSDQR